jgi:hypothetical protein
MSAVLKNWLVLGLGGRCLFVRGPLYMLSTQPDPLLPVTHCKLDLTQVKTTFRVWCLYSYFVHTFHAPVWRDECAAEVPPIQTGICFSLFDIFFPLQLFKTIIFLLWIGSRKQAIWQMHTSFYYGSLAYLHNEHKRLITYCKLLHLPMCQLGGIGVLTLCLL